MTSEQLKYKSTFRYNMSFYYQSTIIYFVVFGLYLLIRGEIVDNSYTLVIKDPIIYLLALIVIISLLTLLFNIYKKRHIEISSDGIVFVSRVRRKEIPAEKIESIRFTKKRKPVQPKSFRLIVIKLKNRKRRILIRPTDYENFDELINRFKDLKQVMDS